jgi:hypothetical protein
MAAASQGRSLQEMQAGDERKISYPLHQTYHLRFVGFLESKEIQEQVARVLRTVTDHSSNCRYPILKERLRKHLAWLIEHQVQLQHMIDLLGTYDDYKNELARLLENFKGPDRPSHRESDWRAVGRWLTPGLGASQSTLDNMHEPEVLYKDMKLPYDDDAVFLADLCVLRDEHPAYANIAGEIIQEATESLGVKLKKVSNVIARCAEKEIGRLGQEISSSFEQRRLHAEMKSKMELRDLVRRTLDEEPKHPTELCVL